MNYNFEGWNGFKSGSWNKEVNVRDFIVRNYTPYDGDEGRKPQNFGTSEMGTEAANGAGGSVWA